MPCLSNFRLQHVLLIFAETCFRFTTVIKDYFFAIDAVGNRITQVQQQYGIAKGILTAYFRIKWSRQIELTYIGFAYAAICLFQQISYIPGEIVFNK